MDLEYWVRFFDSVRCLLCTSVLEIFFLRVLGWKQLHSQMILHKDNPDIIPDDDNDVNDDNDDCRDDNFDYNNDN